MVIDKLLSILLLTALSGILATDSIEKNGTNHTEWWESQRHRHLDHISMPNPYACMLDNYQYYQHKTNNLGCTAQDIKFSSVAGFEVYDSLAAICNCHGLDGSCDDGAGGTTCNLCTGTDLDEVSCELIDGSRLPNGTYIGACLGIDDNVNISFSFNIEVNADRFDVGLYIETTGRSVLESGSTCSLRSLVNGTYGDVSVMETEDPVDGCLDITGSGLLTNYAFQPIIMQCADLTEDNLLDFDVGISWYQREGGGKTEDPADNCSFDYSATTSPPYPGTSSKCWHTSTSSGNEDPVGRINLPIYVPPYPTPSSSPSSMPSLKPSLGPSISLIPSQYPSSQPSLQPSSQPSSRPSEEPSSQPSQHPSEMPSSQPSWQPTSQPSSQPSMNPSVSVWPSSIPSESPSISTIPSVSSVPSSQPSMDPTASIWPTSQPSSQPSYGPSAYPSEHPSSQPSSRPSEIPSGQPSVWPSGQPSSRPSEEPSSQPSHHPTEMPSSQPSWQPTSQPSSQPSMNPSVSVWPSSIPSESPSISSIPSISIAPSSQPSMDPTASIWPTSQPSSQPSYGPSLQPSEHPSSQPSTIPSEMPSGQPSDQPSSHPSENPSSTPSAHPSMAPSISAQPSISVVPTEDTGFPSISPSISLKPSASAVPSSIPSVTPSVSDKPSSQPSETPSRGPSSQPSASPSSQPSESPSISTHPTLSPSFQPSISQKPSVSSAPSISTDYPTDAPSNSQYPSVPPTIMPSISLAPTVSPTEAPSSTPSASPTDGFYYPDWIHETQVCTNNDLEPQYMIDIQRNNYLYRSKEECCETHFWWRIAQCMDNNHPMWYKNGEKCEQKTDFENWQSKYTPANWDASDLFETVEDCCVAKFWYDIDGCIGSSPQELSFTFTIDIAQLNEPTHCQDADIIGNALETAIDIILPSNAESFVTGIGCATIERNADSGNPECGGCLAGTGFLGGTDGQSVVEDATGAISTITVQVRLSSDACQDSACFNELYGLIREDIIDSVNTEDALTREIIDWARERVPPVPMLWSAMVLSNSYKEVAFNNPYVTTASSSSGLEVTTSGSFQLNDVQWDQISSSSDLKVVASYLEDAMEKSIPEGSHSYKPIVTNMCGVPLDSVIESFQCTDDPATVEYISTIYLSYDADPVDYMHSIVEAMNDPLALSSIENTVLEDAVNSGLPGLIIAMGSISVSLFSIIDIEVISLAPYYPNWLEANTCTNDGRHPVYQRENEGHFLFDSLTECCEAWFAFDPLCGSSTSSQPKFFPSYNGQTQCGSKTLAEFQNWETEMYDTLDDCCASKFPNNVEECCSTAGLGGCSTSGTLQYIPVWLDERCEAKDSSFVLSHEEIYAYDSIRKCCENNYPYDNGDSCCNQSDGGC